MRVPKLTLLIGLVYVQACGGDEPQLFRQFTAEDRPQSYETFLQECRNHFNSSQTEYLDSCLAFALAQQDQALSDSCRQESKRILIAFNSELARRASEVDQKYASCTSRVCVESLDLSLSETFQCRVSTDLQSELAWKVET